MRAVIENIEREMINRNMGCIEIFREIQAVQVFYRLIETWDVLKFLISG